MYNDVKKEHHKDWKFNVLLWSKSIIPTWKVSSASMTNWKPVVDRKSRFRYYLRISFDLMDSVVVNAPVIYKKKVNAKMSLLNFKIILAELLINRFSSRKCKITAEESHFTVELPQPSKEPDHIVQFTEERQHCQYCFTSGKKGVKCFTYCKPVMFCCVSRKTEITSNCTISFWEQLYNLTKCWWTSEFLDIIIF